MPALATIQTDGIPLYFRIDSIRHYLILDLVAKTLVHHARSGMRIDSAIVADGRLALDPPGIEVDVAAFFASV